MWPQRIHDKNRNFDRDIDFYLQTTIKKTATKFISDPSHVLQGCYKTKYYIIIIIIIIIIIRVCTSRFSNSFIPFSSYTLNRQT
mgnify:CR=1 FL=1